MLPKLFKHWLSWLFPLLLIFITALLCARNYTPGTWLTGWDTLHPEFDFSLNISRLIQGVWRADQGVGAVAAHAHMSELPRVLILWVLHLFLPLSFVRYAYIFLCFILGPLGIYVFATSILGSHKKDTHTQWTHTFIIRFSAFLTALLYLFNLATVQQFIVIFEMFAVQYASLGWLFWSADRVLHQERSHKNLAIFALISLLSAPMAYASTLWLATYAGLGLYLFFQTLIQFKFRKTYTVRLLLIGVTILLVNAFWLLPNLYFLLTPASHIPGVSHINQLFSQEAFLQNQEFGTFKDLAIVKNFLFQWNVYDFQTGEFTKLLQPWINHISKPSVLLIGYLVATLSVLGAIFAVLKKSAVSFLIPVFALGIFMLINANPPFTFIFDFLRTHSGLFEEGFRFPFTKFSFLFTFSMSIFAGASFEYVLAYTHRSKKLFALVTGTFVITIIPALIWYGLPMFQGELISEHLRKPIPVDYFEFFKFMDTQPHQARLAVLPAYTSAGWEYQTWGYQGAGFVWFGIPQSVLVRDFDRWNPGNEDFYEQISTAMYGKDTGLFQKTVSKYQVNYVLLNDFVTNPNANDNGSSLQMVDSEKMLTALGYKTIWSSEHLRLFQTPLLADSILSLPNTQSVTGVTTKMRRDPIYDAEKRNYYEVDGSSSDNAQAFPFVSLNASYQNTTHIQDESDTIASVQISAPLSVQQQAVQIHLPELPDGSDYTALANFEFLPGLITVNFLNKNSVQIGSQIVPLPQLPPVSIDISKEIHHAVVHVGNTNVDLTMNAKKTVAVTMKTGEPITFLIFDKEKPEIQDLSSAFTNNPLTPCWKGPSADAFAIASHLNGVMNISFNDASLCQSLYLLNTKTSPYYAEVTVPFLSKNDAHPYMCIASENAGYNCLNHPEYSIQKNAGWTNIQEEALLGPLDYFWIDLKNIPSLTQLGRGELSFKTPFVRLYALSGLSKIDKSVWQTIQHPLPLTFQQSDEKEIKVNIIAERKNLLTDNSSNSFFENCSVNKQGQVSEDNLNNSLLLSSSENGIGCKSYTIDEMSQHAPHLISIVGENKTGRSLKMYVYNQSSNHIDLEELLPTGVFNKNFSVLGWENLNDAGYKLSFENRSFGRISSQNSISTLNIYTLPLDWISNFSVTSSDNRQSLASTKVTAIERHGNYFYSAKVSGNQQTVLMLSEAYDGGWIAWDTSHGFKLLKHVKLNSWANGWIIEGVAGQRGKDATDVTNNQATNQLSNQQTIVILFWPQLLEFLGLGMLVVMLLVLAIRVRRHRTFQSNN